MNDLFDFLQVHYVGAKFPSTKLLFGYRLKLKSGSIYLLTTHNNANET